MLCTVISIYASHERFTSRVAKSMYTVAQAISATNSRPPSPTKNLTVRTVAPATGLSRRKDKEPVLRSRAMASIANTIVITTRPPIISTSKPSA